MMNRTSCLVLLLVALLQNASSFTTTPSFVSRTASPLKMASDDEAPLAAGFMERGVSVDQDGKSNVWAIEPKMEVSSKSSEEKTQSALIAGGGLAAVVVAAGAILANLPDPSQY